MRRLPSSRPQAAPFSLLSYAEIRKRSKTIADVTQRRYMPPWLPEKGHGDFRPDFADAHYELAVLCIATNNLPIAYSELQKAVQLDPQNSQAYGNLGYVKSRRGHFKEARADRWFSRRAAENAEEKRNKSLLCVLRASAREILNNQSLPAVPEF